MFEQRHLVEVADDPERVVDDLTSKAIVALTTPESPASSQPTSARKSAVQAAFQAKRER